MAQGFHEEVPHHRGGRGTPGGPESIDGVLEYYGQIGSSLPKPVVVSGLSIAFFRFLMKEFLKVSC